MPCQPYNAPDRNKVAITLRVMSAPPVDVGSSERTQHHSARHAECDGYQVFRHALILGIILLGVADAEAQWLCPPTWGPPPSTVQPYPVSRIPYPLPPIDGNQPTTTAYGPVDEQAIVLSDATDVLQTIPGALRVIVPEAFLNRLLARNDVDAGPVTDVILGANVSGNQNTQTTLTVDVEPSADTARLQFQLTGTTNNETVGVTPQAAVRSRGTHQFRVTKQVDFDGLQLTTRTPAAWVTPQLTNEGAATSFTGVPVLGPIASQIALTEAERRRPIAEQIITQRVTEQVAPRFNSEVDQQLFAANVKLQQIVPRYLAWAGLSPDDASLSSTDDRILFGLCVPESDTPTVPPTPFSQPSGAAKVPLPSNGPLLPAPPGDSILDPANESLGEPEDIPDAPPVDDDGFSIIRQISNRVISQPSTQPAQDEPSPAEPAQGPIQPVQPLVMQPPPSATEGRAFTVALHEQFVNHLLSRLPTHGAEIPDRTIDHFLESLVDNLTSSQFQGLSSEGLGNESPEFATIVLSKERPLSVRFDHGEFRLVAAVGFKPRLTPEVPPQRIEIPFTMTHENGEWMLVPGTVSVDPLPGADDGPMEELARPIIRQQITERLKSVPLPTVLPLQLPGTSHSQLTVREVTFAAGWLLIAVD